jgi:hypothetical protein
VAIRGDLLDEHVDDFGPDINAFAVARHICDVLSTDPVVSPVEHGRVNRQSDPTDRGQIGRL